MFSSLFYKRMQKRCITSLFKDFAFGQWVQRADVDVGNAQFVWNFDEPFELPLSLIFCDIPTANKENSR